MAKSSDKLERMKAQIVSRSGCVAIRPRQEDNGYSSLEECMKPISNGGERQNQYVWPFVMQLTIRKLELCCHFIASTLFRDCQRCTHLEMQRNPNRMKETSCFLRCTKRKCTYFHFSILRVSLQRFSLFFHTYGED